MEAKQYATKKTNGSMMNSKRKSENTSRQIENENTIFQNLWDAAKAVLRGKFIVIDIDLPQRIRKISNNLTYHLRELEKEEQSPKSAEGRK